MNNNFEIPKKIVWLASYPKSGNTWVRAFLTALFNNGEVDINRLNAKAIFASRELFHRYTDLDSTDLTDEEAKEMLPEVFNCFAATENDETIFIKVHDALAFNQANKPIIPTESTLCAIYLIRNPLDIAGSLASHNNISIDMAVKSLLDDNYCFAPQQGNFNVNLHFRQFLSTWSNHVESWTKSPEFPVKVFRYEDLVLNPFNTFKNILEFIGLNQYSDKEIINAIEASEFKNLIQQELTKGFSEKPLVNASKFFRKGEINTYKTELSPSQIKLIISQLHKIMTKFGYI